MRMIMPVFLVLVMHNAAYAQAPPGAPSIYYPYGYYTGPQTAQSPIINNVYYTVSAVQPVSAMAWPAGVSVITVLSAQGINAANGWTISRFNYQGQLRLDNYYAWTEAGPAITQGSISVPSSSASGAGGIVFGLHYTPAVNDPSAHWIQVIHTNVAGSNKGAQADPFDPNGTWYIDNFPNPDGDPFYDTYYAANATDFIDRPQRPYSDSSYWRAYLFLAYGDLTNKTL